MNKQELKDWIKSASFIDVSHDEHDSNGNHEQTIIYKKDDKLYSIDYCNGGPTEIWKNNKGYIRGAYQPQEVTRHIKMIEQVYYEPVDKIEIN